MKFYKDICSAWISRISVTTVKRKVIKINKPRNGDLLTTEILKLAAVGST